MMLIPLTLLALAAAPPARLALQEYAIDSGHSIVQFSVGFALTRIQGRFPETHGTILYDPAAPERSSVSIVIDAKSIDTGSAHRDDHLRTDDFFDVARFPTVTFQSTSLARTGDRWTMTGPLTLHGVTREVAIPFRFVAPPSRRPESGWMGLNAVGAVRLARKDFGLLGGAKHNPWFNELRSAAVAESVDVDLEIEGWFADAESQRSPALDAALGRIRAGGVAAQLDRMRAARGGKSEAEFAPYFRGGDLVVRGLIAAGRDTEAVALARGLVALFPRLAGAHLVHGFALAAAGDADGARASYARALELDPRETRAIEWRRRLKP